MARKLVIVRHGERVDFTFGESWIDRNFDETGKYCKQNMNMPDELIKREGYPRSFRKDCPLTQVGLLQGKLVGKGLLQESILRPGFEVYSSPSLRSIQTATAILEGMGVRESPLKVEPCLFEWTGWYVDGVPGWVTNEELNAGGYNTDPTYHPHYQPEDLEVNETVDQYYNRSYDLVSSVVASTEKDILLVAHGSTLDSCTRQLLGFPPREGDEMLRVLHHVPYAGVAIAEQDPELKTWTICKNGSVSIRHSSVNDFDGVKILTDTTVI